MSVLAVVADLDQVRPILGWAITFAKVKNHPLTVLCWSYSPVPEYPLLAEDQVSEENDDLVEATERFLSEMSEHALLEYIKRTPEVELVACGRPSTLYDKADVVIVLSSPHPLPRSFADELTEICQREMGDSDLVVEVHCILNAWQDDDQGQSDPTHASQPAGEF